MTLRFAWTKKPGSVRAPAGDRVWPVLGVLVGLLTGATALEFMASRMEAPPLVVQIGETGAALAEEEEEDDTAVLSDTPALNETHARARAMALRGERQQAVELFAKVVQGAPKDAALHAEYGFWLLRADQSEKARTELELAAKLEPNDPRTAFKRGLVLARLGDRSGAEGEYRRALALLPAFDRARVALGNSLVRREEYQQAAEVLAPAATRGANQDRARALVALGRAELGRKRFDLAERAFSDAVERAPAHAEMRMSMGRAWLKSSRNQDVSRAVGMMSTARDLAPESPAAQSGLAQALERAGDDTGAERAFEEALRLDPHYLFVRKRLLHRALDRDDTKRALYHAERLVAEEDARPEYHFLLGLVTARAGEIDEARGHYQAAIQRDPNGYPEAWLNLGRLEAKAGSLDAAATAYRRALELRPKYAAAQNNLGLVLEDLKDTPGAEQAFRAAIALSPRYESAHVNLGSFLSRQTRYLEAIGELEAAIHLRGGDYPSAELNLSVAYLRKGESRRAVEICRKLIERRPRYVAAWYDLGLALRESKDLKGASEAFQRALELNPEHNASVRRLAELEMGLGRAPQAVTLYRDLLDRDGSDTSARLALADLYRKNGDRKACVRELRVAQTSSPDSVAKGSPGQLCAGSSSLSASL